METPRLAFDRNGRDRNLAPHPVETAKAHLSVRRAPFAQSDHDRELVIRERGAVEIGEAEHLTELVGMDWPDIVELDTEQLLGGLVVVDQVSAAIHHPHRDGEVAGQLSKQDHLDRLLR